MLDTKINHFHNLKAQYKKWLANPMDSEAMHRLANDPFFNYHDYILNDLSKWISMFKAAARQIDTSAEILGIDRTDICLPIIAKLEMLVADVEKMRSEAQAKEHEANVEMRMKILKLQSEMLEKRRQQFWGN